MSLETPLDILPGFRADLAARKGDEVKVVEVKTRTALGAMPEIGELARRIDEKDGWSFGLVLVGEPEKLDVPDGVSPCAAADALQRIEQAENALASGGPEAALLLAWAAIEAAARNALTAEGVADTRVVTGSGVLHQTVFYGIVSREEHERLKRLQAYRNAVAHGLDVEDFDEGVVSEVIDAARWMVQVGGRGPLVTANRNPWLFPMPRRRPKSEWAPVDADEKSMAEIFEEPVVQEQIAMLGRMFDLQQRGPRADRED